LGDVYWPELLVIGRLALWAVVFAALASAADYFRRFNQVLSPALSNPRTTAPLARRQTDRKAG
jgi:hypothetical protein